MRLHVGSVPEPTDFVPNPPWRAMREPSVWVMQLIATPIGVVTSAVLATLWFLIGNFEGAIVPATISEFLVSFAAITLVHELIHAATHPGQGLTSRSLLGVWPSKLLFYAHYDGELTRNRFIAILLMPFLCMSLAPLLFSVAIGAVPGWVAYVSVFNALLACGDLFGATMVLLQVSPGASVHNHGYWTYWKLTGEETCIVAAEDSDGNRELTPRNASAEEVELQEE